MNFRLTPLAALLSFIVASPATAQESAELDPIVVTATRQAQRANDVLSDITVIKSAEIREAGPTATITELLARQPGIEINQKGGVGTDSSVFIRGSNTQHVLVLIDGVRFGSATLGYPSWGFIPLEQIDHIEIIRGSASSLYGSDAIGGVIQIFTKRGTGPFQSFAEAGYGTWNTKSVAIGLSGSTDNWRYNFQLADKQGDSFSTINNPQNSSYNPDKDGYKITSSSGNLSYSPTSENEIGISYLVSDGWNRYDSTPKASDFKQYETTYASNLYSRNKLTGAWTSTLKIGQSVDDGQQFTDGKRTSDIRTAQTLYQWQNDIKLPIGSALLAAERVMQHVSGSVDYDLKERSINSILAGWTGHFAKHRLQLNARNDNNSQFGDKTTGALSYGYQISPDWRASASYGSSFKAPSFNDMYWPGSGNPNLKPETGENREASIHYETSSQHASLTYYHNDIRNLIEWAPGAGGVWAPANVARANLTGWTLAYVGEISGYHLSGSLDLQAPEYGDNHKTLRYRARQIAKFGVDRDFGSLGIGAEILASSRRYNDVNNTQALGGYAIANLHANYRLDRGWSLFARANNIFDKEYALVKDYSTPGRNIFVGVRYAPK